MEIGNEISQKIRSAIKAKLIELGAYVDDELPDYIMVMVANKKTHKQMTDDLSLFLSHNTEKFSSWLQNLLKKLQSINTGAEPSSSKHKSKEKHKGDKRKRKSSQSEKSSKTGESEKKKASISTENGASKAGGDTVQESKKETASVQAAIAGKTVTAAPVEEEVEGTEINISENTDEFNEENKEIEKRPESTKSSSTGKPPPAKVTRSKKSVDEPVHSSKSSARRKSGETTATEKHSETRKKPSSFVVAVKRKYEELGDAEEEYDPANPAVGSVASIVRGPTRKSSVPQSLQANKSLLMKAVSDAEKSVTTTKKTEVPEKQEPGMHSDRKPMDLSRRLKTPAGLQLISRSKRKELEKMTYTVTNQTSKETTKRSRNSSGGKEKLQFTVRNEPTSASKASTRVKAPLAASSRMAASAIKDINKQSSKVTSGRTKKEASPVDKDGSDQDDDEQYGPPLPDTRLVQHSERAKEEPVFDEDSSEPARSESESPTDHVTDPEIQRILDESHELTEETEYLFEEDNKRVIKSRPSPETVDPKFIVTLDGVDPLTYSVLPEMRESVVQPIVKPEIKQEAPIKTERPMVAVEPEMAYPAKITPPKIKPFNINLKDTDDEEEGEENMETTEAAPKTIQEKCRFWPACANGNACQYIHPSIPCKTFPYCKFGEKCLYIHPNCKFDAQCTRFDCPYTHASKRASYAPTVIHKVVQVPVQQYAPAFVPGQQGGKQGPGNICRFFPNCKNMNCQFVHPKPCRYGIACMNKASCMFSHPSLPEMGKMKWSATTKKEDTRKPDTAGKSAATGSAK